MVIKCRFNDIKIWNGRTNSREFPRGHLWHTVYLFGCLHVNWHKKSLLTLKQLYNFCFSSNVHNLHSDTIYSNCCHCSHFSSHLTSWTAHHLAHDFHSIWQFQPSLSATDLSALTLRLTRFFNSGNCHKFHCSNTICVQCLDFSSQLTCYHLFLSTGCALQFIT